MKLEKRHIIILLAIVHLVGLIATLIYPEFIQLTPLNLLLVYFMLFVSERYNTRLFIISLVVITLGITVEAIGVNTGVLFGDYQYQEVLGPKIFKTPYLIGVNWFLITYCSYQFIAQFVSPVILRVLLSALICTLFDFVLEPVAIHYHFWSWSSMEIPLFNYLCWFLFSLIFTAFYRRLQLDKSVPTSILVIWFVFFIGLSLFS